MSTNASAQNTSAKDQWILNQLIGIRMLEQEVAATLRKPSIRGKEQLRNRILQLNAWVDAVDHSLAPVAQPRTA